jgi:hypothetical protein
MKVSLFARSQSRREQAEKNIAGVGFDPLSPADNLQREASPP